jgi:FSR family fosmidomycin resistance protein-like MFS transporter
MTKATRALFLTALGHLALELNNNFLPIVYPLLISTFGWSYSQVGAIALISGVGASLAQPLFGYVSDRWQPRLVVAFSIIWNGVLMALVGFSWNYLSLLLLVALGGLGSAAFHPAGASMAFAGGSRRRGAAVSVFSVGGNVGSALSPLWVTIGIDRLGLRGTAVLIPVALLVGAYLYRQLEPMQRTETLVATASPASARRAFPTWLMLIVLAMAFRNWFQVSLVTFLPTWIEAQGGTLATGSRMLFVYLAAVGAGSLAGGALSDRIGRWQVLILSLGLLGPMEWVFLSASQPLQYLSLGLTGALLGATFPVSIVLAQEAWPGSRGVAAGMVIGLPWVGGGLGASLTGFVADQFSLGLGLRSLLLPALLAAASILLFAAIQRSPARPAGSG